MSSNEEAKQGDNINDSANNNQPQRDHQLDPIVTGSTDTNTNDNNNCTSPSRRSRGGRIPKRKIMDSSGGMMESSAMNSGGGKTPDTKGRQQPSGPAGMRGGTRPRGGGGVRGGDDSSDGGGGEDPVIHKTFFDGFTDDFDMSDLS
mmetsp:Transcript_2702/g.6203  ORF Transcript_2702/g.6203 Transcript_2702/m.6203 type:complete len:146 (+) Transcript_2702:128-565(+)